MVDNRTIEDLYRHFDDHVKTESVKDALRVYNRLRDRCPNYSSVSVRLVKLMTHLQMREEYPDLFYYKSKFNG